MNPIQTRKTTTTAKNTLQLHEIIHKMKAFEKGKIEGKRRSRRCWMKGKCDISNIFNCDFMNQRQVQNIKFKTNITHNYDLCHELTSTNIDATETDR